MGVDDGTEVGVGDGVVAQEVEPAVLGFDRRHERADLLRLADVTGASLRLPPIAANRGRDALASIGLAARYDHACTVRGKGPRDRFADATARAGDQRDL